MIFVPLPFVTTLLFVILLVQMARQGDRPWRDNAFFLLLVVSTLQSVLIGLRWGYDIETLVPLQSLMAALAPALAWLAFHGLTSEASALRWSVLWPHLLPTGLVALMILLWPAPIDLTIILIFLGYGLALTRLALAGPDVLIASRLDGVLRSYRALQLMAGLCLFCGVTDILISFDMHLLHGANSGAVVALGNLVGVLVLGTAAASASTATVSPTEEADRIEAAPEAGPPARPGSDEDKVVAEALGRLMAERQLYKDVDLNLGRLARRLNLPARSVSSAVNRIHGMSVSNYVNKYRVEEACRLLEAGDGSVIQVMMEAGFLSKSNFNREFLRLTGVTPLAWRRGERGVLPGIAGIDKQKAPPWRGPETRLDVTQRDLTQLERNAIS